MFGSFIADALFLGGSGAGSFTAVSVIRYRVRTYAKRVEEKWTSIRSRREREARANAKECRKWAKRYGNANDYISRAVYMNAAELWEALAEVWKTENWPDEPNRVMLPVLRKPEDPYWDTTGY